ncbi:peptidyl-prolyl cis-trans isomerase [Enterococcus sp. AZ196]|uniref:peptidyl-prolyl cis-trans isomerase n=1 Tax=Enterococcus sp. AZ196 TaxID=2774659 RepID=UPI003D2B6A89
MKKWLNKFDWDKWIPLIKKHQKKLIIVIILVVGLLGVAWWHNSQWVMKVNGQKISNEEYAFYQKVYPSLEEKKLKQQIVEDKVQLQQAKKRKLDTIDDYPALVKEMKKRNKEQEKKVKNKQVIYGLRNYTEETFYVYTLSITVNELKKQTTNDVSDKQVKEYYNNSKEEFKTIHSKELYRIRANQEKLTQLKQKKITEEQLSENPDCIYEKISLNESNLRDWIKYRNEEVTTVNELKAGTWSEIFKGSKDSLIYYCISDEAGNIQPISDVKEKIKIKLEKKKYQESLKKWVEQAKVDLK